MGCVHARWVTYTPTRPIEKLKQQNGYHVKAAAPAGAGGGDAAVGTIVQVKEYNEVLRPSEVKNVVVEEKKMNREGERDVNGGNAPRRITVRKIAADELIDGWPKWLVENIPRDVLAGLVPKSADSYDKLAKVGQGTYSNVYKARDRDTGKIVALKKIRFDTSEPESVKFMAREIIILKQLDHPTIIKLLGLATSRMQYSLYLVLDFMPSDLSRIISRPEGRLTEPQIKCYMQQLLSGLQHCHERGILHRDIKGSNLLIDKNGMLKIADFGLANYYHPKLKRPLTSRVVTLWYRAPELLLGSTDYGVGIDLWSAGCLLAEMFVGRPIIPGRNEIEQLHKIFKLCGSPSDDYWKKMKPPTTFRPPPHYKPCFQEAFPNLPDSALGLSIALLSLDPADRGTAASALESKFFSTSPLACGPAGLPLITEEDEPTQFNDRARNKASILKLHACKSRDGLRRKVSFPGGLKEDFGSSKEQEKTGEPSLHNQEINNSSSSSASSLKPNRFEERSPPSPPPAFHSRHDRSAKTVAHPNALKNIQNYPLLLASLTEAANHLEASRSSFNQRSMSTIDFRKLDFEKISKLFVGLEDN